MSLALVAGVLLAPGIALSMVLILTSDDIDLPTPTIVPVLVIPESVGDYDRRIGAFVVRFGQPMPIGSNGLEGTVTDVFVEPGDQVRNYQPLVEIDGVRRLAVATDRPFYRELSTVNSGWDVRQLELVLADLGLFERDPDESFTSTTRSAVIELQEMLGVDRPNGRFSPALFVYVSVVNVEIVSVAVDKGVRLSGGAAELLAVLPDRPETMLEDGQGNALAPLLNDLYTVEVNARDAFLVDGGGDIDQALFEELSRIGELPSSAELGELIAEEREVTVGLSLGLAEPRVRTGVPSTSIMTSDEGTGLCVWAGRAGSYNALTVTVLESVFDVTIVQESFESGAQVLANPIDVLGKDASCP